MSGALLRLTSFSYGFVSLEQYAARNGIHLLITAIRIVQNLRYHHYHPYNFPMDLTNMTPGASGRWLGTRTGAGGTTTLA